MLENFVKQPIGIDIPRKSDPVFWGKMKNVYSIWSRNITQQLGIDSQMFIKGLVLSSIIGDDVNCFPFSADLFDKKSARISKRQLGYILDWEINIPETPDLIRDELVGVKSIFSLSWDNSSDFKNAKEKWEKMKQRVQQLVDDNWELKYALEYHLLENKKLATYWEEFLIDRKVANK